MTLRGRINQHVADWRYQRTLGTYACNQAKAKAKTQGWTRLDYLFNFIGFCCVAAVAFALSYVALCFVSATYPATTCIALQLVGLCK